MEDKEIELADLIDQLDVDGNEYADFFRPMLGYETYLKLFTGITDDDEPKIEEIENETGYEFPAEIISLYICTNGGQFGDLYLYPILSDMKNKDNIYTINVFNKEIKEDLGLEKSTLLVGEYPGQNAYITCRMNDKNEYVYEIYNAKTKKVQMQFEYLIQIVALEMNYLSENDSILDASKK